MSSFLTVNSVRREVNTHSGLLTILDRIDLVVEEGQSVAIQGASGSGKSTLLSVLAGLDLPQSGSVKFEGVDITLLDEDRRASLRANRVGFVFQSFHLIEDLTALENVALPLELFGVNQPERSARHWLNKLGLADRCDHRAQQLSGGEQQRVALCRAFAVQPALLFADEPTANLDIATANDVVDQLFTLQGELNTTLILATHDNDLARRCDRRLQLHGGRLIEVS